MSLKEVYGPYFKIGTAVSAKDLRDPQAQEILKLQYNSITCENAMKPRYLLDENENRGNAEKYDREPAVRFDRIRDCLEFASANGIGMRGHTLVWHGQTPEWFFMEGYRTGEGSVPAGRDVMLARLEHYIRSVLEFVQEQYPGTVYAWDVVNEAAADSGGLRASRWTQTAGEDFILQAFRFAKKYAAPGVKLFYNDYNTYLPCKREMIIEHILKPLLAEGLVDGVGMQSHLLMHSPESAEYDRTVRAFGSLGLEVQITELDIHNAVCSERSMEELAKRYREIFSILLQAKKEGAANITGVTFWGMRDETSWLTEFRKETSYPLLFSGNFMPKMAYHAVMGVPRVHYAD